MVVRARDRNLLVRIVGNDLQKISLTLSPAITTRTIARRIISLDEAPGIVVIIVMIVTNVVLTRIITRIAEPLTELDASDLIRLEYLMALLPEPL